MVTLKDLLTTYWTQSAFVLTGLGIIIFYWIKRKYDLDSKKTEIKFGQFYEQKIKALAKFIERYGEIQTVLMEANARTVAAKSENEYKNVYKDIFNGLSIETHKLSAAFNELRLFLKENEREGFREIIQSLNGLADYYYGINQHFEVNRPPNVEADMLKQKQAFQHGTEILNDICSNFQKEVGIM